MVAQPQRRAAVRYVGHATVLVDLGGVRLLTDPLLRSRVAHLRRVGKVDPAVLRGVDAILISHLHYDHLDLPSLQRLGPEIPVVAPRGAGALIRRKAGTRSVVEVRAGEQIEIGALTVRATPAEHDSGRLPFGVRAEPLGYLIEGDGRSVYFAGDSDVFRRDGRPLARRRSRCCRSGAGGRRSARATWIRGGPRRPRHSSRPASRSRSTGAPTIPIHLGLQGPPAFLKTPPADFERELRVQAPATVAHVLQPGEEVSI